ncbi:MAG: alpha/beta hydrolase [Muribaculaceae bacterium]
MRHSLLFTISLAGMFCASHSDAQGVPAVFEAQHEDSLAMPTGKTDWVDPVHATPVNTQYVVYPTLQRGEGTQGSCMVYLPEEYGTASEARYPVIYYLHGGAGNQREGRWLIAKVDAAIKSGKMKPVIIVCPQALPIGWYINANESDPKVTSGPIEDVLIKDLIPYIDANYRTRASREGRGIEGFSMGGRGTLLLAFKHPDLFCAASSVAGALVDWDEEPLQRALECTFGDVNNPYSKIYFDAWHPRVFACQNVRQIVGSGMHIRMFVGDKDRLYEENGHHITQRFHELLEALHIPHTLRIVPGANHNPSEIFAEGVNDYDTTFWDKAFGE